MKTVRHHTGSEDQTRLLGIRLGRHVRPGTVIAVSGELGSGKTRLTQGIAKGLQVPEEFVVTSPTFAIINEYPGRIRLYHVDLYRIVDSSELEDIGLAEILADDGVTVIEWADRLSDELPSERVDIAISVVDETKREFYLTPHGQDAINWLTKCVDQGLAQDAYLPHESGSMPS